MTTKKKNVPVRVPIPRIVVSIIQYDGPSSIIGKKEYERLVKEGNKVMMTKSERFVDPEDPTLDLESFLPAPVFKFINAADIGMVTPINSVTAQELMELFPEFSELISYFIKKNKAELESKGIDTGGSAFL